MPRCSGRSFGRLCVCRCSGVRVLAVPSFFFADRSGTIQSSQYGPADEKYCPPDYDAELDIVTDTDGMSMVVNGTGRQQAQFDEMLVLLSVSKYEETSDSASTKRVYEVPDGRAVGVGLLASIGTFLSSTTSKMTARAIERVPVDWQVHGNPGASAMQLRARVRAAQGVRAAQPVGFAQMTRLPATTAGTTQHPGPGGGR